MKIPKIKLVLNPETDEAKAIIGYKYNDVAGTRHFLGGEPENLYDNEFPNCKSCDKTMTFYAQIDSIGDQFDLADCMVIHNFVCFDCFTVQAVLSQVKA